MIGLKISKPSQNVFQTSDADLQFSSGSKTLQIEKEGYFEINDTGASPTDKTYTVYEHKLGYNPVYLIYHIYSWYDYGAGTFEETDVYRETGTSDVFNGGIWTDKQGLHVRMLGSGWVGWKVRLYYFIFRQDMEERVEYPIEKKSTEKKEQKKNNFGLSISKSGKEVQTAVKDDLLLSSNFISMQIHKIDSVSITYTVDPVTEFMEHNLDYDPMCLGFFKNTNNPDRIYMIPQYITFSDYAATDNSTKKKNILIYYAGTYPTNNATKAYIVIFKDVASQV